MSKELSKGLMFGKKGLVIGVANNRSVAWAISKALHAHGAEIALTYQGDSLKKRVEPLAKEINAWTIGHCDVTQDSTLEHIFGELESKWGHIDFLVHSVAYADKAALTGRYIETTTEQFLSSLHISSYSLVSLAKRSERIMPNGGSILTLSYYGAEKWMPHYNVMGVAKAALECSVRYLAADLGPQNIRVNALSAGPIKTLAASGISDFRYILDWNRHNAPLRRTISLDEVGNAGLYLLSDLSSGVTGEVHHVDAGYHIVGMKRPDAPDIQLTLSEAT
jgi:enoyl-[acyl-carrier protein] reductase I